MEKAGCNIFGTFHTPTSIFENSLNQNPFIMRLSLILCFLLTGHLALSQKSPIKFGDIPVEDMKMVIYDKDSSAAAVVLTDFGVSYVSNNTGTNVLNTDKHVRIKILKKDGFNQADITILLRRNGNREDRMSNLKAVTYNLEGGKVVETKMEKDGIFKDAFNKNFNRIKFTMPNVKEGSVLEYTYHIASEFYWLFPNWQFQSSIPKRWSEYWAMTPDFFVYEKYMQGYIPVTNYEVKQINYQTEPVNAYHWVMANVPAFKEEPYMTCEDDYISRINFALSYVKYQTHTEEVMGTWEKLNADLLESDYFGKVINGSGFLQDQVNQLTAGMDDPLKKIEAISNWIKQNIEWDGDKDFEAYPLKKIIEKKKGTSGDINILLGAMIKKAGIDMDMVMLSTRDHGFIRTNYPMTRQFNYVICVAYVNNKTLMLDATEKYLPYDLLPQRCLNGQGLIISANRYGWLNITANAKEKTIYSASLALEPTGELKGNLDLTRDGYDAYEMRTSYFEKGEESYLKRFSEGRNWNVQKGEIKNVKEFDKGVKEIYNLEINEHGSVAGDVVYVNPFIIARMEENPFKSEKREYPVDFGNNSETMYLLKLTIPEGYQVDELPKSKVIALPGNAGRYTYNMVQTGNVINLTSNFQINKPLFTQAEYPVLREFYNVILAKEAEQIVIKKKP